MQVLHYGAEILGIFSSPHPFLQIGWQTRMMGHEGARCDRNRARKTALDGEFRQVALQGPVDVELPLFCKLHGRGGSEELGYGANPVNGIRGGRDMIPHIRKAKPFGPDNPLIVNQREGQTRHIILFHLLSDKPGDVIFGVGIIFSGYGFRLFGHCRAAGAHKKDHHKNSHAHFLHHLVSFLA